MARKWRLFYRRIQLFLAKKIKLSIVFILTFIFILNFDLSSEAFQKYSDRSIFLNSHPSLSPFEILRNDQSFTTNNHNLSSNLAKQKSVTLPKNIDILNIDRESILISDNNITNSANKLVNLGLELYQQGKFDRAKQEWSKAELEYQQKNDRFNRALVLNYLSLAYQKLGDWTEAKTKIDRSFQLIETELDRPLNSQESSIVARIFNTRGKVELALGKVELALNSWQKSENVYRQLNDREGVITSQLNQAIALQKLGRFQSALDLLNDLKINLAKIPENIRINGLISLGNILRQIGKLAESSNTFTEALTLAENSRSPLLLSNVLIGLGNTQRAIANREIDSLSGTTNFFTSLENQGTISNFQSALDSYQKVIDLNLPQLKLQAQLNKLSLLADINKFSSTQAQKRQIKVPNFLEKYSRQADNFWQTIQIPSKSELITQNTVYSRISLADSLIRLKANSQLLNNISWAQIEVILEEAIVLAQNIDDRRAESEVLGKIGKIAEIDRNWQQAENFTRKALLLSQSTNANEISYKWQWQLGRIKEQQNDRESAIKAYSSAIETLQILRNDLVALSSDLEFSFRENVEPIYRELVSLLLQPDATTAEISQARDTIEALQLAELDNFFRAVCLETKPVSLDRVTQEQDPSAVVIYTILLDDRLETILKLPQQEIRHYSTPIANLFRVERLLERLALSLTQRNSQETLPLAQKAYDLLIRPIETDLANSNAKTLVFILDGSLRNLPMSVLHDGQQYLLEKYAVALSPGLQLIAPQPIAIKQLRTLTAGLTEARGGFPPLDYVVEELETIQLQVPTTEKLLNNKFTSTALQAQISQLSFPVVHLATHGQFSSEAEDTFLLTWDNRINVNQLNSLLSSRNPRNRESIELLVLSACETLRGNKRAGLGLAGVAVRAGASSTMATLWRVNDEASALLMGQFYQELANRKTSINKSEALRQAQLALLADSRFDRPYFWGSYVLVGNWL